MVRPPKEPAKKKKKTDKYEMPEGHLKGTARKKGDPIMYDELKVSWNIKMTPTAKKLIIEAAKKAHVSPSELIERWARKELVENAYTTKEEE